MLQLFLLRKSPHQNSEEVNFVAASAQQPRFFSGILEEKMLSDHIFFLLCIAETRAKIQGPGTIYIKGGSTLKLSCKVYLGQNGPDSDYRQHAVVHWFHEQRLLDPALENWRSR